MKKIYRIKAIKRTWLEVEADSSLSQDEVYDLAKEKLKSNKKIKWEDPELNIIGIKADQTIKTPIESKVNLLKAIDHTTGIVKKN